jgi:hypothetical protein
LFRSAGLDLNFAGGVFSLNNTRTASPANIPGWSFSRTDTNGIATALDLAGNVIQFPSRTNLLLQSQTFGTTWVQDNATVTSDFATAPDGSNTADRIVETVANLQHGVWQSVSVSNSTVYSASFFVKPSDRDWVYIQVNRLDSSFPRAWFNVTTGALGTVQSGLTASITSAANGFYRVTVSFDSLGASPGALRTALYVARSDGEVAFAGDITKGVIAWGAQLETGSTATAYIPTTTAAVTVVLPRITNRGILVEEARTNLQTFSHGFTSWTVVSAAVTNNAGVAPDGTNTADKIVVSAGSNSSWGANRGTAAVVNGSTYTTSIIAKTAGYTRLQIAGAVFNGGAFGDALIDLTNNTVVTGGSGVTFRFESLANGWVRISGTWVATASGTPVLYIKFVPSSVTSINQTYTADGTSGGFIWGLQLELGAFATSPIITTGAAGTRGVDAASIVLPSNVSSFAATYNSGTTATGAVTPGATFDLVTARAWLNGYLQRFRVT